MYSKKEGSVLDGVLDKLADSAGEATMPPMIKPQQPQPSNIYATASAADKEAANIAIGTIEFPTISIPKDSEGFVQSFAFDDFAGIQAFFDTYGFVVVNNILDKQAVEYTIEEIWSEIERKLHTSANVRITFNLTLPALKFVLRFPETILRLGRTDFGRDTSLLKAY